jgi:hypothetical protein
MRSLLYTGLAALTFGLGSVGALANDPPSMEQVVGLVDATIDDVPEVTADNWQERVAEGYSVVLIYAEDPSVEAVDVNRMGEDLYLAGIQGLRDVEGSFYRLDTHKLFDQLGSEEAVTEYLDRTFGVRKRPSLVFFCNGERIHEINGSASKPENFDRAMDAMPSILGKYATSCE